MAAENEIKAWLEVLLKNENLKEFSVKLEGNSEKGDGYMGDIVFVEVDGISEEGIKRNYNLVLKCAKKSVKLRKQSPVKDAFLNEIFFYEKIFPSFLQFQKERNVDDPFDKVPRCYGTLIQGEMEILALENLKKKGYILWDRRKPLTRKHINLVTKEYAKFHAVSLAMKQQRPQEFEELAKEPKNIMLQFTQLTDMVGVYQAAIEEIYNLLKDELDTNTLDKWMSLKSEVRTIFARDTKTMGVMNLIIHGDSWNNNFMHCFSENGEPSNFAILDWQVVNYSTPIHDLSYFLFACLSEEDMDDLHTILKLYHQTLVHQSKKLGCDNAEELYPYEQLLDEWRKLCRFGILITTLIHKYSLSEKDDVPDMVEAAEKGEDVFNTFTQPIKNTADWKKRMSYIVKYVVEHKLI